MFCRFVVTVTGAPPPAGVTWQVIVPRVARLVTPPSTLRIIPYMIRPGSGMPVAYPGIIPESNIKVDVKT